MATKVKVNKWKVVSGSVMVKHPITGTPTTHRKGSEFIADPKIDYARISRGNAVLAGLVSVDPDSFEMKDEVVEESVEKEEVETKSTEKPSGEDVTLEFLGAKENGLSVYRLDGKFFIYDLTKGLAPISSKKGLKSNTLVKQFISDYTEE